MDISDLIDTFSPMVLRIARSILNDIEDAKDVSQEVFMQLLKTKGINNYEAWLYRATMNKALNVRKQNTSRRNREKKRSAKNIVIDNVGVEVKEQADILREKISSLPQKQREIFLLRHQGNMSIRDIAMTLDVTEGTIKKQLSRALIFLRQERK